MKGEYKYDRLATILEEHELRLAVKYDFVERDGGVLIDGLRLALANASGDSTLLWRVFSLNPALHADKYTVDGRSAAIFVDSHDEANTEMLRYDALCIFGDHIVKAWRGSMSPDDYFPYETPNGPYPSYAHYRAVMVGEQNYTYARDLLYSIGDERLFERLERAARLDAGLLLLSEGEPVETETRAEVVTNFAPSDPEHNIDDALHEANEEVDRVESHGFEGGNLQCPFCRKGYERANLSIYDLRTPGGRLTFLWGCAGCFPNEEPSLTLDRMTSLSQAMRWTEHLLSKRHYQHPKSLKSWLACLRGIFGYEALSVFPL